MNNKKVIADLSNAKIKGYVNRGNGLTDGGVTQSESGVVFENDCTDLKVFPMFAVDFEEYIASGDIKIEDVKAIEMVAILYDDSGSEIDLSLEYQKCAFVSRDALDGYSSSDILPTGNYKAIGSNIVTKFDLAKYADSAEDGKSALAKGAGINIQIVNGDYKRLRYLVISSLAFVLADSAAPEPVVSEPAKAKPVKAKPIEQKPVVSEPAGSSDAELVADLSDSRIKGYVNRGYGMTKEGVTQSERGLSLENIYEDLNDYPMFAIDFSEYLAAKGVNIEDVESFEIVASIRDAKGEEIDLSSEHQKCAFVSREALDGYSSSDILPSGNYKQIGSGLVTTFDLTQYTGYTSDGSSLSESSLEEGVGFNVQIVNGDHSQLRFLVISRLVFKVKSKEALL